MQASMPRAWALVALASLALPACSRGSYYREVPAPAGAPVVMQTPSMAGPPPAPGGGAPAGSPESALLDEQRRAVGVEAGQAQVLVADALKKARDAAAAGDVEGARAFYQKALELDPSNEEARRGWQTFGNERPSNVAEFFEGARREESVRRDQAIAQVQSYVRTGQTMEAQEDFDGAVKQYQSALAIVSWYANQAGFGVTSESLQNMIDDARAKAAAKARDVRALQIRRAQVERERDLARERDERLGRIRAFFREADLAYHRGEYTSAREYARAVLREDPTNAQAKALIDVSLEAEHAQNMADNKHRFDEEWKSVFEQMEAAILPQVAVVEFPANWAEISMRRPRAVGDTGPVADAESRAAIVATLEGKRVKGLTFTDANLDQVVQYLRTVTGLNFHITNKVRASKFDDTKVNIPMMDDVSVREVLDLITGPAGLRWEPRGGVVTIAMPDEVGGSLRLRYFDVKDLAVKIQNFRGTDIYLVPSNYTPPEPPELAEPQPFFPEDQLLETIKTVVDPESWTVEGATIEIKNHILIAKNTTETLDRVNDLLSELRTNSGPLVNLEVRFMTVEDNFLRDVGVDIRGLGDNSQGTGAPGLGTSAPQDDLFAGTTASPYGVPFGIHPEPSSAGTSNDSGIFYNDGQDGAYQGRVENLFDSVLGNPDVLLGTGGLSFQHTFLDDTQLEVILRAVQKSERIQNITANEVTVYNTQRAVVEVLNKVAYVGDYDVEIAQAANIANPIIKHAIDGVVLDVKPVVSADRRFITLELRPTVAVLRRPIPTFSTSLASNLSGAPVIIQVPEIQKSSVRTTVTMPDGGTLLLGGLKFYEQVDATSEVPVLGKIPVLSFLFSRKGSYINRRNLLILITANVVALEEIEPRGEVPAAPLPEPLHFEEEECVPDFAPPPSPCGQPVPCPCGR
jgi:type II secretory pathway component GspD/PulD (secretin)/tetratricopeptide (TPR) repeat protein